VVLDGWHRVKAVQDLRRESIGASITSAPESEWFLEAVKANIMHGMQFSNSEIVKLILELENQGITRGKIGEIVRIPAQSIERFVNQHITREKPNEPIRKIGQSAPASASKDQERIALLDKIIQILEKDFAELNTEAIKERLKKIKELIEKLHL
jgi:DNA-binding transcriptional MerR regulator